MDGEFEAWQKQYKKSSHITENAKYVLKNWKTKLQKNI